MTDRKEWLALRGVSGIYAIENTVNGKIYIGQAQDVYRRWHAHMTASRAGKMARKLMNAWRKYGEQSFRFFVVERCAVADLDTREQAWIDTFDAVNSGYNVSPTAGSVRGTKQTDERRKLTAERVKAQWQDSVVRQQMVASVTETRRSESYRSERATQTAQQWSGESRAAMVEGLTSARRARSPITDEAASQIRARYIPRCPANGCTALAREFGVSISVVSNIVNGKTWT
jgi:group I intron endonuclease